MESSALDQMLAGFTQGGSPAKGLPAEAYTSDAFWRLECDTVLSKTWVCAGFAHELAEPGDVSPVTVAGKPLLLVKNAEGEIAAFHKSDRAVVSLTVCARAESAEQVVRIDAAVPVRPIDLHDACTARRAKLDRLCARLTHDVRPSQRPEAAAVRSRTLTVACWASS